MLRFAALILLAAPVLAAPPHSGIPNTRTMPELSDVILFLIAVAGVAIARRALRARFRRKDRHQQD